MMPDPGAVLPLHDDEPTLIDRLERVDFVRRLRDMVAHCRPPQVLGVHGDWGAGKTSFLHQLQWELTGECPQQPEVHGSRTRCLKRFYEWNPDGDLRFWTCF